MYKTIYVRKGDEDYWERGEELAKRKGMSLTKLLSQLLRNHLMESSTSRPVFSADPIDVQIEAALGDVRKVMESLRDGIKSEQQAIEAEESRL